MSLNQQIYIDRETIISAAVVFALSSVSLVFFGHDWIPAVFESFLGTFLFALLYAVAPEQMQITAERPKGALGIFAGFLVVALISFAGDCVTGAALHHAELSMSTCTKSGIGFFITLVFLACAFAIPVFAALKSLVRKVLGR